MIDVSSRAHRILKPMSRYHNISGSNGWPLEFPVGPILKSGEHSLGVYINDPVNFQDSILFTTFSLYVSRGTQWAGMNYSEIQEIIFPEAKPEIAGLTILQHDGRAFFLPVRGRRGGRFSDAFEILRFLDRVRSDAAVR